MRNLTLAIPPASSLRSLCVLSFKDTDLERTDEQEVDHEWCESSWLQHAGCKRNPAQEVEVESELHSDATEAWRELGARALPHLGADAERLRGLLG